MIPSWSVLLLSLLYWLLAVLSVCTMTWDSVSEISNYIIEQLFLRRNILDEPPCIDNDNPEQWDDCSSISLSWSPNLTVSCLLMIGWRQLLIKTYIIHLYIIYIHACDLINYWSFSWIILENLTIKKAFHLGLGQAVKFRCKVLKLLPVYNFKHWTNLPERLHQTMQENRHWVVFHLQTQIIMWNTKHQ